MLKPAELHRRAADLRKRAEDAPDPLWKVTLNTIAEEFEHDAVEEERLAPGAHSPPRA
ncbi:MAG TPA: hypothetical protein VFN42_00670 [Acetobacteraceae bacterium]|nr:hypothetical protein [Acetobacteraceae bacterium]